MLEKIKERTGSIRSVRHQPGAPILEVESLSLHYGKVPALIDVSFQIDLGERVAVVGPNGAGKSTLFKVIAGVLRPGRGTVRIGGYGPQQHICIAYLPQRNQVDWSFPVSVADVVMMGRIGQIGMLRWPRAGDWEIVGKSLQAVGMADLVDRQISGLSGGQQQRMFIARALAQQAELVLMDEPFAGLDLASQEMIFHILDDLRDRNVTVLVAMHDLNLAADRFDQVLLINRNLLGFGAPGEVFTADKLKEAYSGHLHMVQTQDGVIILGDTCCDDGVPGDEHLA